MAGVLVPKPAFARYLVVGATATAVHYLVLALWAEAGLGRAAWGAFWGAVAGAAVSFEGNRRFTFEFRARGRHWWWALGKFAVVSGLAAVLHSLCVALGTEVWGWHYLPAQMLATAVVLPITYGLNRAWSFAAPPPGAAPVSVPTGVKALWAVLALLLLARLAAAVGLPLIDPAEGRYAEIGRKMFELNDWVTPWHQYGVPFWGKPPLSFWMTAASFQLWGLSEWAARLPHLLAGVVTVLAVGRVSGRRDPQQGLMAMVVLASALLFFLASGAVMTDSALVMGTTVAMVAVWRAVLAPPDQRWRFTLLAVAGGAVGVLAKGPLALVLVGAPWLLWALWTRRWAALWHSVHWVWGSLLLLALCLPWYLWAEQRSPGFLAYFIGGEHIQRFLTPGWAGDLYGKAHSEPVGTIWLFAAGAFFPWTLWLPLAAAVSAWRGRSPSGAAVPPAPAGGHEALGPWALTPKDEGRFMLLWAVVPLLFFTTSRNIIWTYVLPALPGLALLGVRGLVQWRVRPLPWVVSGALASVLLMAAVWGVMVGSHRLDGFSSKNLVAACQRHHQALRAQAGGVDAPAQAPVVFLGRRSFSGVFYTQGQAQRLDDWAELEAILAPWGSCVALSPEDWSRARSREGGPPVRVEADLGHHHNRQVLWVRPRSPMATP